MLIATLGGTGRLGRAIQRVCVAGNIECHSFASSVDVIHPAMLRDAIGAIGCVPDAIINCAVNLFADDAERNPDAAKAVSVFGAHNVATLCRELNSTAVYISSDFVFGGSRRTPYLESTPPCPLNVYGAMKVQGERATDHTARRSYIIRTASLFGGNEKPGKRESFVARMLHDARAGKDVSVLCDVFMSPSYVDDVAAQIVSLLVSRAPTGVYHVVNSGQASWYELAAFIYEYAGGFGHVMPQRSSEIGYTRATRPFYSVLGSEKLQPLRTWKQALRDHLAADWPSHAGLPPSHMVM